MDNKTVLEPEDDVAHVKWGDNWRMPTSKELSELFSCTREWTTYNGVNGLLITGPNGNSIFLPATGRYLDTQLDDRGKYGYYWSATLGKGDCNACRLSFSSDHSYWDDLALRSDGRAVRPVKE